MKFLLFTGICLAGLLAFTLPDFSSKQDNYQQEKIYTLMRKIGHELLLHAGDKHSRVLPVEKLTDNSYLIKFETSFLFETPQLVDIVQKNISEAGLPSQYIVSVLGCGNDSIFYSYEYTPHTQRDSLNCLTRENKLGCYNIKISLADGHDSSFLARNSTSLSLSFLLLAVVSFVYLAKKKKPVNKIPDEVTGIIKIGNIHLDTRSRCLVFGKSKADLTEKEARILTIFAKRQNQVIERDQLLKEVWEDEGVFVGRSLDVFISRLRKKLEMDPKVCLANVHGRGYKLQVRQET